MSQSLHQTILEIAHHVSRYPLLKTLLSPAYSIYRRRDFNKRASKFKQYGLEALDCFHKCLLEHNIPYTLAFGTLLGAIREKGFIPHDIDIDVSMFIEDYNEHFPVCLKGAGFELTHEFLVNNGRLGREQTYEYKGVSIDVFFFYPPLVDIPYCCDFLTAGDSATYRESMLQYGHVLSRRLELPISRERRLTQFENRQFYVPTNADELLKFRYGPNYLVPDPNWTIHGYDTHIYDWEDVDAIYKEYTRN